jgi:hypothetical protein
MRSSRRCGPYHRAPEDRGGNSIRMSNSGYTSAFSRRDAPEVCVWLSPQQEGAGNAGCALHPRSRVQRVEKKMHTSIQGSGGDPTFPAQWLYGLFRALPGESGFVVSVASRNPVARPGRAFAPPQDLTPTTEASGPHDFTVRFSIVRPALRRPLTETRPANKLHARHRRVHHIPSQRSVTMANAPSSGTGWRES